MILKFKKKTRAVAWINEKKCIGCGKCSQNCPINAIIGTKRHLHTILSKICTGCNLCITSCPTDCIEIRFKQINKKY